MQPFTGHQGEKLSTSLCPSPPQEAAESNEITPQLPFLQTRQARWFGCLGFFGTWAFFGAE